MAYNLIVIFKREGGAIIRIHLIKLNSVTNSTLLPIKSWCSLFEKNANSFKPFLLHVRNCVRFIFFYVMFLTRPSRNPLPSLNDHPCSVITCFLVKALLTFELHSALYNAAFSLELFQGLLENSYFLLSMIVTDVFCNYISSSFLGMYKTLFLREASMDWKWLWVKVCFRFFRVLIVNFLNSSN